MACSPEDYGPELCRQIAKVRPELDSYLITDRSVEAIAGLDLGLCRRVFYNQEDFLELAPQYPARCPGPVRVAVLYCLEGLLQAANRRFSRQCRSAAASRFRDRTGSRIWGAFYGPQHLPCGNFCDIRWPGQLAGTNMVRSRRHRS